MQTIIPQILTILNDSVPEDDAPLWGAAVSYKKGNRVIHKHFVFEALTDNSTKDPWDSRDIDGAAWRTIGATNKYKCIDPHNHTQTVAAEGAQDLIIQVPFDRPATALALLNIKAASVRVTLSKDGDTADADGIIWDSGDVTLLRDSIDWWDYFFGGLRQEPDKVFTRIPPVTGVLAIELRGARPAIGNILVGEHVIFGLVEYGVRTGFVSYSSVTTDAYGNTSRVKRGTAKRGSYPVYVHPDNISYVQQVVTGLNGEPALWIGDNGVGVPALIIYGDLVDYEGGLDDYGDAKANFEVRGLI